MLQWFFSFLLIHKEKIYCPLQIEKELFCNSSNILQY